MRLADFIVRNNEAILAEWETFAASLLPAASGMTSLALRDHAKQILEAVTKDIATPQTKDAQSEKSKKPDVSPPSGFLAFTFQC